MSVWQLFLLGGLRAVDCANCGARIGVSRLSYLVVLTFGTWTPVAGAVIGAITASGITGNNILIDATVGIVLGGILSVALYFRGAKLVVI
ncbi:hypothetical protein [Pseudoxanthomonas sacheonensis]|uniref:hypothetical protein n=1 Tax=Pseudoxanthomonas sacheonensis TaxID=443615 RepID=UPI0013D13640|nr:hypothetical protein [Pseudoxanthomonas sacheonensis]